MRRRDFVALVASTVSFLPLTAHTQTRPLLVWFGSATPSAATRYQTLLRDGLTELGYTEGKILILLVALPNIVSKDYQSWPRKSLHSSLRSSSPAQLIPL
jgi:hypothetical protein